jgi:hypothetical protein
MAALKARGNLGLLDNSLSHQPIEKRDQQFLPPKGSK